MAIKAISCYDEVVWENIKAEDAPEPNPSWFDSICNIASSSRVNIFYVVLPFAWAAHWNVDQWGHDTTFVLCLVAMIPLQKTFDWAGEEMGAFLATELRDLVIITLSNAIEATLAVILLLKCELRLLQSTIIGVVLLHLLLVPGVAFFVQGTGELHKKLEWHHASLNLSLLMIGVLAILVPTAFFAALDRGSASPGNGAQSSSVSGLPAPFVPLVSDYVRKDILRMSRGIAIVLLVVYIVSRLWRHLWQHLCIADKSLIDEERGQSPTSENAQKTRSPVNLPVCIILLLLAVTLMAPTAEFLVSSIEPIRESSGIQTEWFGLILLPIVSFSPDAVVAILKFGGSPLYIKLLKILPARWQSWAGGATATSSSEDTFDFAHGRPIDLSIQFTLWWAPFLVLLGWWTDRPMHMLFDYFEVALLLGACFLVNYVLSDQKTNSAEGLTMVSFYAIIATAVWYYPGQPQVAFLLNCPGSVAEAVAGGVEGMNE
ncbi:hypothetical protein C8Q80DRAFT_1274684 [Daedaleopsis nitida]|nr:hypothetical protein C8Q80DRAFT_1274684 [Daedaleopsis nitida]